MDDGQFREILNEFNLSWEGYRKVRKGVKKRLSRHMKDLCLQTVPEYLHAINHDSELRKQVARLLSVSISRFFRDRKLWQDLGASVLPRLVEMGSPKARVWSAGCACGEEAYSFAIAWDQYARCLSKPPEFELTATDCDPSVLEKARAGVYSASSLKEVDTETAAHYFVPTAERFMVRGFLKRHIIWRLHDLIEDEPPSGEFQLVFLRNNLLTYCGANIKHSAVQRILNSLAPGGFLIIGAHEKIPPEFLKIELSEFQPLVLQKRAE
ncbi:MAG: hypothetical protein HY912_13480 [Desulfomonile tiedjei]|uniref:CheR-type methyltransferase domain-containing protein n=1 Tax=Desulfomonile tiedjei TaxID=2358 RepID=A0A9D6Z417_9BACT|nr:hypothetical protein [Desulfomonile tiedjei]